MFADIVREHVDWAILSSGRLKCAAPLCGFHANDHRSRRDLEFHISALYRSLGMEERMTDQQKVTCQWAFNAYNELAKDIGLPVARAFTDKRYKQLCARFREVIAAEEDPKEIWDLALKYLEESAFCRGANDRGWKADLDFILQPSSFWRLVEGRYSNVRDHQAQPAAGKSAAEIFAERYAGRY
jgi:hypothetical protein